MKIAFIILAHQHPANVAELVDTLVGAGHEVLLHYDANAAGFDELEHLLNGTDRVYFVPRIRVEWGRWSMLEATLKAIEIIVEHRLEADYVHLMSGVDLPIRPLKDLEGFLAANEGIDFIEAVDITHNRWVKGGIDHDRYRYRHFFNWQRHRKLFDYSYHLQKALGLKREFFADFIPHMGSQWWTLTRSTCEMIFKESSQSELTDYFKTVWIPDEMYIQTLVGSLLPRERICGKKLTLNHFDQYGLPLSYYDDHIDYLRRQDFFFARKISPGARKLRSHFLEVSVANATVSCCDWSGLGVESVDYKVFEAAARRGFHPYMKPGRSPKNDWFGYLHLSDRKYFVVHAPTAAEGDLIQKAINGSKNHMCHGQLFDSREIAFAGKAESYAGFNKSDIVLRDDDPAAFLIQVIHETEDVAGFVLTWDREHEIRSKTYWDGNAVHILVKGSFEKFHQGDIPADGWKPAVNTLSGPQHAKAFSTEIAKAYMERHSDMLAKFSSDGRRYFDIDLNEENWQQMLMLALSDESPPDIQNKRLRSLAEMRVV